MIYTKYKTRSIGVEKIIRAMDIYKRFVNLHDNFILLTEIIKES